jgi:hypothetical protein
LGEAEESQSIWNLLETFLVVQMHARAAFWAAGAAIISWEHIQLFSGVAMGWVFLDWIF